MRNLLLALLFNNAELIIHFAHLLFALSSCFLAFALVSIFIYPFGEVHEPLLLTPTDMKLLKLGRKAEMAWSLTCRKQETLIGLFHLQLHFYFQSRRLFSKQACCTRCLYPRYSQMNISAVYFSITCTQIVICIGICSYTTWKH